MPAEEPLAGRLLVALAATLWAVLVPGEAGRLMEQPLRCPDRLRLIRLARRGQRIASGSARAGVAVAPNAR